jgi:hypothetical protein
LSSVASILTETEVDFLHLARAAEYRAWLDTLDQVPAKQSYESIESALRWRYREANPRLPDVIQSLALGLQIAVKYQDRAQALLYQQRIATVLDQVPSLPDSFAQSLWQARFEHALAQHDATLAAVALTQYAALVGTFTPNAAFDQLQLMRMQQAQIDPASHWRPDPDWLASLRQRMGAAAPSVAAMAAVGDP